ncbi:hypothetical protein RRG08_006532, partial [Elysia crispata]
MCGESWVPGQAVNGPGLTTVLNCPQSGQKNCESTAVRCGKPPCVSCLHCSPGYNRTSPPHGPDLSPRQVSVTQDQLHGPKSTGTAQSEAAALEWASQDCTNSPVYETTAARITERRGTR